MMVIVSFLIAVGILPLTLTNGFVPGPRPMRSINEIQAVDVKHAHSNNAAFFRSNVNNCRRVPWTGRRLSLLKETMIDNNSAMTDNASDLYNIYERIMDESRSKLKAGQGLGKVMSPDADSQFVLAFAMIMSARGVAMTEPVEGWIRRAGQRCVDLGWNKLGKFLIKHSGEEANHHVMYINDLEVLAQVWNEKFPEHAVDLDALMDEPLTRGQDNYISLHEDVIKSEMPYRQIAIENEIERLSVVIVPSLLKQFGTKLGKDVLDRMSFLPHHAEIDVGHTARNQAELTKLLGDFPHAVEALAESGGHALEAFGLYLDECAESAELMVAESKTLLVMEEK